MLCAKNDLADDLETAMGQTKFLVVVPSLAPVVACNFTTEIAVVDSGEQLAKAVGLTFQGRVSDGNLLCYRLDCSIFEKDRGVPVFSPPAGVQKAVQIEFPVFLAIGNDTLNHCSCAAAIPHRARDEGEKR